MKYKIILQLLILLGILQMPLINAMKRPFEFENEDNFDFIFNNDDDPCADDNVFNQSILTNNNNNSNNTDDNAGHIANQSQLIQPPSQLFLSSNQPLNHTEQNCECPIKGCFAILSSEAFLPQHMSLNHQPILALIQQALVLNNSNNYSALPNKTGSPLAVSNPISTNNNNNNNNNDDDDTSEPLPSWLNLAKQTVMMHNPNLSSASNNNNNASGPLTLQSESSWSYYQCPHCEEKFNYDWDFKKHALTQHGKNYGVKTCKPHIRQSLSTTDFAINLMTKDKENHQNALSIFQTYQKGKATNCPYQTCNKEYSNQKSLKIHVVSIHLYLRYVCRLCKKSTSNPSDFINHMATEHRIGSTFIVCKDYLRWMGKDADSKVNGA